MRIRSETSMGGTPTQSSTLFADRYLVYGPSLDCLPATPSAQHLRHPQQPCALIQLPTPTPVSMHPSPIPILTHSIISPCRPPKNPSTPNAFWFGGRCRAWAVRPRPPGPLRLGPWPQSLSQRQLGPRPEERDGLLVHMASVWQYNWFAYKAGSAIGGWEVSGLYATSSLLAQRFVPHTLETPRPHTGG